MNEWKFKYIDDKKVGIPPSMPSMDYNTYNGFSLQVSRKIICDTIKSISSLADKEYARDIRQQSLCESLNINGKRICGAGFLERDNTYDHHSKYNLMGIKYKDEEIIKTAGRMVLNPDKDAELDIKISMLKQVKEEKSIEWLYKDIDVKDRRWIELLNRYSFSGDPKEYHKLCRLVGFG